MKILILRFSSIGDIVLTTPVIRCLYKSYPGAEIHYATKKAFAGMLQSNPYVHKVHVLENSLMGLVNELKKENFDYVVDLHNNQRTFALKALLGGKNFAFNKLNIEKWLLVNFKINYLPDVHIVDRYLATCQELHVTNDGEGLDYFIPKEDEVDIETLSGGVSRSTPSCSLEGGGYIGWVIGAKQATKKFPVQKIINTLNADFADIPVVLLGGKEDEGEANRIYESCKDKVTLYNACGKYSLNQSASLVKQARLIITNDTGLMHIAAAFKKPVISLWGNTVPQFGMYPYYGKHKVANAMLQVTGLNCRPCSKLGYDACPKGHFKCMNELSETAIIQKVSELSGIPVKA